MNRTDINLIWILLSLLGGMVLIGSTSEYIGKYLAEGYVFGFMWGIILVSQLLAKGSGSE